MKGPAIEITERLDEELRQAARKGDAKSLRDLLGRGAGVASTDEEGWTTLMLAAASGSAECLKLLRAVDPTRRTRNGVTALMIAAEKGWAEGVELLLGSIESGPRGARRRRAALAQRSDSGGTPLIAAAKSRNARCARLLLPGSDSRAADMHGRTALMWAATGAETQATECVEALLSASGVDKRDRQGWAALDWAVAEGRAETVALLARSIDPRTRDKEGRSAFDRACERGGDEGERIRRALLKAIAEKERDELGEAAGAAGDAANGEPRPRSL